MSVMTCLYACDAWTIAGDIERRTDLSARLQSMPQQLEAADGVLRASQDAVSAERQKAHAEESRLQDLRTAYESIVFDEDLLRSLEATAEQVFRAKALQEEINGLTAEAKERAKARDVAETNAARAETAHRTAHSDAELCAEALRHARAALEDGRNRDRAAALRAHLHTGDACPVCMQTVSVLPADEAPPELARLEKACKEAEERAAKAGVANQKAAEALATAAAKRDEAARAAEVATTKGADRASDLTRLFEAVSSMVPSAKTAGDGPSMLVWMERRRGELRAAKVEMDRQTGRDPQARRESREDAINARRRGGLNHQSFGSSRASRERSDPAADRDCRGDRPHSSGIPTRRSSRGT